MNHPEYTIVIHYSCESFYDRADGSSPRITSIAVYNIGSGQTNSFSIHQKAEIKKYSRNDIEKHYEELEKLMLDDFYDFVKLHEKYNWLHWNMRDINYGFQAIAHRYKVLGGDLGKLMIQIELIYPACLLIFMVIITLVIRVYRN